jgi:hypothetical protein
MARLSVCLSFLIVPLVVVLAVMMSVFGSVQPINPALRGFVEGCEGRLKPCWYGIVVQESTLGDAEAVFARLGYEQIGELGRQFLNSRTYRSSLAGEGCTVVIYYSSLSQPISEITFNDCELLLGDMAAVYGTPDKLHLREWGEGEWTYDHLGLSIGFSSDFALYTSFDRIIMNPSFTNGALSFGWHGYAPHWRYCQLEPDIDLC